MKNVPRDAQQACNLLGWLRHYRLLWHWHPWIDEPKRRGEVRREILSLVQRLRAFRLAQLSTKPLGRRETFPGFQPLGVPGCPRTLDLITPPSTRFTENSLVRSLRAIATVGLKLGEVGTVVHGYPSGGVEVEFSAGRPLPIVMTMEDADLEGVPTEAACEEA